MPALWSLYSSIHHQVLHRRLMYVSYGRSPYKYLGGFVPTIELSEGRHRALQAQGLLHRQGVTYQNWRQQLRGHHGLNKRASRREGVTGKGVGGRRQRAEGPNRSIYDDRGFRSKFEKAFVIRQGMRRSRPRTEPRSLDRHTQRACGASTICSVSMHRKPKRRCSARQPENVRISALR